MINVLLILALLPIVISAGKIELLIFAITAFFTLLVRSSSAIAKSGRRCLALPEGTLPLLILLGLELPIVPAIGTRILAGTVLIISFGTAKQVHNTFRWIAPLLILLGCSAISEVLWALPEIPVLFQSFGRGLRPALGTVNFGTVNHLLDVTIPSLSYLSKVIVFGAAVLLFESSDREIPAFQRSLAIGMVCACIFTILQALDLLPFVPHGQNSFWSGINRVSGSFSDPNAQGVFLAIVPFVLMAEQDRATFSRYFWGLLWILISVAGLLSGSRTFLIGIMLMLVLFGVRFSRRLTLVAITAAVCCVAALSLIDYFTPFVDQIAQLAFVPEGLRRGIKSLSLIRLQESFFSRSVFLSIGSEIFRQTPLLGVGADRFRYYVPAVTESLGLDLGGWVDNSNNFYLGLLAELGIIGCIAFLGCVAGRTSRRPVEPALYGLGILALLLLTGPHIDFSEVLLLAAFCVGRGTQNRNRESSSSALTPTTFRAPVAHGFMLSGFVLCGLVAPMTREYGEYFWGRHQWLSPRAHLFLSCPCSGPIRIAVEAPHLPYGNPMQVRILQGRELMSSVTFDRPGTQEVSIACPESVKEVRPVPFRRRFTIVTDVAWSPAAVQPRQSRDFRPLGVRLRYRKAADLLGTFQCGQARS